MTQQGVRATARGHPAVVKDSSQVPLVVVMGVSGSGKTTVGEEVARRLAVDFGEADEFHPRSNIEKMESGVALDDDDRAPWLAAIGEWLAEHDEVGAVATCSALKRAYRDTLRRAAPGTVFLHLAGSRELLAERMGGRRGHFMPASLLDSQLDTLESLQDDEDGISLDVAQPPERLVELFLGWWRDRSGV
jgi:gluconokinase